MTLSELLVYLLVVSLSAGLFIIGAKNFIESFKIRTAKLKIDTFLERMRQQAISHSRRIKLYYNEGRILASTGDFIEGLSLKSTEPFIFGFTERGLFFVEMGSTIVTFSDDSTMVISPVTGKLTY
ncbi:hypothetical protein [Kosmotoga pacifica]|uniref:Uncharacterized protein n=1 Tax=Kosmotoga pacifica TaxID=1330330 RepID=A0A0G2Z8I3_9BACT|nr:hypothetical protein [Kosmotoga pacifica]AKI97920.1 hypothetical protein IX53_08920 [Kosmotoga pacifica]